MSLICPTIRKIVLHFVIAVRVKTPPHLKMRSISTTVCELGLTIICPHKHPHTAISYVPLSWLPNPERKKSSGQNAIKGALWRAIVTSRQGYLSLPAALIGFQLPAPASKWLTYFILIPLSWGKTWTEGTIMGHYCSPFFLQQECSALKIDLLLWATTLLTEPRDTEEDGGMGCWYYKEW